MSKERFVSLENFCLEWIKKIESEGSSLSGVSLEECKNELKYLDRRFADYDREITAENVKSEINRIYREKTMKQHEKLIKESERYVHEVDENKYCVGTYDSGTYYLKMTSEEKQLTGCNAYTAKKN